MSTIPPENQQGNLSDVPSSFIPLGPALWLDLDGAILIYGHKEVQLTAQEVEVLRILVRTMRASRCYLRASAIAQQLISSEVFDPEHCIEQTISTLRRKLGETPYHPRILRGRRGLGYRLFPESALRSSS